MAAEKLQRDIAGALDNNKYIFFLMGEILLMTIWSKPQIKKKNKLINDVRMKMEKRSAPIQPPAGCDN